MPNVKAHSAISKQRTGFDFYELHNWIDNAPHSQLLGFNHRLERHSFNEREMRQIKEYWNQKMGPGWGEKAVIEWLFHIALDNLSTAFKLSKKFYKEKTYNIMHFGLNKSNYIHTKFESIPDELLGYVLEDDSEYE